MQWLDAGCSIGLRVVVADDVASYVSRKIANLGIDAGTIEQIRCRVLGTDGIVVGLLVRSAQNIGVDLLLKDVVDIPP
jgi:hypothetical protein